MLAAGGTGGHLFPAFALAEELGRRGSVVELITDMRGDRYGTGFPARAVHCIHSATIKGSSPLAFAKTGLTLARGVKEAHAIMGRQKPAAVVGFGGYPCFPPIVAAGLRGVPTLLHEQNAVLGRANRMLSKRVNLIATSFAKVGLIDPAVEAKVRYTGNPVRAAVLEAALRPFDMPFSGGPFRLLVTGGSQGARFFTDLMIETLPLLPADLRRRLNLTLQCRPEDQERALAAIAAALGGGTIAGPFEISPFFKDLPQRIAASHLVMGRAGASTVAELAVIGRPAILVPLPHALDNDQLRNATTLAESGGAWCIEQKDLTPERLVRELMALSSNPAGLGQAASAAKAQGRPDAVARLADLVDQMTQGS